MFNVTVIKMKDLMKYLVSVTLAIVIIVGLTRYFSAIKEKAQIQPVMQKSYIECLDKIIPGIAETNVELKAQAAEDEEEITSSNVLHKLLLVELAELKIEDVQEVSRVEETQAQSAGETVSEAEATEAIVTNESTEIVTENPITVNPTNTYGAVQIKNETGYVLTEEMLTPNIEVNNSNILIFHTHTCESYTPTEQNQYVASGTYRTTDLSRSVARVGEELKNCLTEYGYNVNHDKTYHDYPAYSGSYTRSLRTVEGLLQSTSSDVVIDLHRDAIGSNSNYAPTVRIGEDYAAQLMFVVGTNGGGLWHPNWNENLKFAVKVQAKAEELYPGLFKPIILRNSRYNQHVSKAATIIEVGATGNTLEQCLTSMKYLSKVISEVMSQ